MTRVAHGTHLRVVTNNKERITFHRGFVKLNIFTQSHAVFFQRLNKFLNISVQNLCPNIPQGYRVGSSIFVSLLRNNNVPQNTCDYLCMYIFTRCVVNKLDCWLSISFTSFFIFLNAKKCNIFTSIAFYKHVHKLFTKLSLANSH